MRRKRSDQPSLFPDPPLSYDLAAYEQRQREWDKEVQALRVVRDAEGNAARAGMALATVPLTRLGLAYGTWLALTVRGIKTVGDLDALVLNWREKELRSWLGTREAARVCRALCEYTSGRFLEELARVRGLHDEHQAAG